MNLQDYIRDIQDFPKPGIAFKDITPLLISPEATKFCLETLVNSLENQKIDVEKFSYNLELMQFLVYLCA